MIAITTFFNPSHYQILIDNYHIFAERIKKQTELLTLEVAFGNDEFCLSDSIKIRSNSVMWLKERLINYGISLLPCSSTFAWIDADVFLPNNWVILAEEKLKTNDLVQLFKHVNYLDERGRECLTLPGIVFQSKNHKNWLKRRENKDLPFAAPGFAWAGKNIDLYDKDIVGSGDCILVDAILETWNLHGFNIKFNDKMKKDILKWAAAKKGLSVDYLPLDISHLWHGNLRNRQYMKRHTILKDFDPENDIEIKNNIFEWKNTKYDISNELKEYFARRQDGQNF